MQIKDKVAIVTGAASGIGEALALRFHADGARHVVVVDRNEEGARAVASRIDGTGVGLDVSDETAIRALVEETERDHGPIDLFVSNAGYVTVGGLETPNADLQRMWEVHVLAHLYAARAVVPRMIEQGGGYLLNTASAAGLLTQIGSMSYAVTKHAAVALSEWIAMTYGRKGIKVSVLCPQAVETNIGPNSPDADKLIGGPGVASGDGVLSSEQVADVVTQALAEERFLVLPHPEVAEYVRRKADDVDRWLEGMRRFQDRLFAGSPQPSDWIGRAD